MLKSLTKYALALRRKPVISAVLAALAVGCFFLPEPAKAPALCAVLTPLALGALCLTSRVNALPWQGRAPAEEDLLRLTQVDADAALLTGGTREVRCAAHPFGLDDALRLTSGSSMLLLATAAILTADTQSPSDRDALVRRLSPLGFTPAALQKRCPVLGETMLNGIPGVICRDGLGQRAYFAASPAKLADCCTLVWDGAPRDMTGDDRFRLLGDAEAMVRAGCHPLAFATLDLRENAPEAAVFLGMLGVGDAPPDLAALAPLIDLDISVNPVNEAHAVSLPWLRRQMGAEDLSSSSVLIAPQRDDAELRPTLLSSPDIPWVEALAGHIVALRQRESALRRLLTLMALLFLLTCVGQPAAWAVPALAAMAVLGARASAPVRRSSALLAAAFALVGTAGTVWFLRAIGMADIPALSAMLLALILAFFAAPRAWRLAWPMAAIGGGVCLTATLLCGAAQPAVFTLLAGLLTGLISRMMLLHRGKTR